MKAKLRRRLFPTCAVFATCLLSVGSAAALGGHGKQVSTVAKVTVGHYTTGEGSAPIVEGKLSSGKAICLKGRSITANFVPGDGSSAITLQGAITKADGTWSTRLPAVDEGLEGEIEVRVASKTAGSSVVCRQTNLKQELTL